MDEPTSLNQTRPSDAARRFLGFAVPVDPCGSPDLVIDAMAEAGPSLGFVPLANSTDWWRRLGGDGPRIMARLPLVESDAEGDAAGGADTPHFVLSPPLSDPVPVEVPVRRVSVPAGTDPTGLDVLTGTAREDGAEEWLVAGDAAVPGVLDTIECGGYHRAVAPPAPDGASRP